MIKIINRKRYNTETATKVASYWNGCSTSDFGHLSEDLYITDNGNWFTSGHGGPRTSYAVSCGNNSWGGSHDIHALTPDDAYVWLEEHEEPEALEKYFGERLSDA